MKHFNWRYIWLDENGQPQRSIGWSTGRVYVPHFIWHSDDEIRNYLGRLPKVAELLNDMCLGRAQNA